MVVDGEKYKICIEKKRQDLLKIRCGVGEREVKEDSRVGAKQLEGWSCQCLRREDQGEQVKDQELCFGHSQTQVLTNQSREAI